MKKTILSLLCAFALLLAMAPTTLAATTVANSQTDTGLDIVVVIDRSGSMNQTDPNQIANTATNMLIDRADAGSTALAVVGFDAEVVLDTQFVELSDPVAVSDLKQKVANLGLRSTNQDTNTGLALKRAKALIDNRKAQHPDHTFAILLLSDGEVLMKDSDEAKAEAGRRNVSLEDLTRESKSNALSVAQACSTEGITISALGIYNGNEQKRLGTDMKSWCDITGGQYRVTNDINDTYGIVRELYLGIKGQSDDSVTVSAGSPFEIKPGVSSAKIEIIPGVQFGQFTLSQDMSGAGSWNPMALSSSQVVQGTDGRYTVVTLTDPDAGQYKLDFADGVARTLDIKVTFNRDMVMTLKVPQGVTNQQSTDQISLTVMHNGLPFYDANYMPVIEVQQPNGQTSALNTTWDASKENYKASFTPNGAGTYTLRGTMTYNGKDNVSNEVTLSVGAAGIGKAKDIGNVDFTGHTIDHYDTKEIDILNGGYISNPDGQSITEVSVRYDDQSDAQYVDINVDTWNNVLRITPKQATSSPVYFYAYVKDGAGATVSVEGNVTIQDDQQPVRTEPSMIAALEQDGVEIRALLPQSEDDQTLLADNLSACFFEPNANDGDSFTVSADYADAESRDLIELRASGSQVYGWGLSEGAARVRVTATSTDGSQASFEFEVRVVNKMRTYLLIGGAALAAVVLLAVIIIIVINIMKPAFRKGTFEIRFEDDGYTREGYCALKRYGKRPVSLAELCKRCPELEMDASARRAVEKLKVYPRKTASVELKGRELNKKVSKVVGSSPVEVLLDKDGVRRLTLEYIEETDTDY